MSVEAVSPGEPRPDQDAHEEIDTYVALELGEDSELRKDLMARLESDASHDRISVSDIGASAPAFFTNAMSSWFNDHVAFVRGQALEHVKTLLASDRPHNGGPGCLIEAEREIAEDTYVRECRAARHEVRQRRRTDLEIVADLERDIAQHQNEFAVLRDKLGREPVIPKPAIYWSLMGTVGIAEAFINYDSFRSLSWATPFIASGTTFAVGMIIALASHMHGTLLKRFRSYFDDDIDAKQRWVAGRMFGIGTTGLTFALAAVAYARNVYFVQTALGDAAFGASSGGQQLWIVGGSLLGNMIVYLVGVLLAYLMHDEVARYAELRTVLDRNKAKRTKLVTSLDGEIAQKLKAAAARRQRLIEQLLHRDAAQKAASKYVDNRKLFEAITHQDRRVIGALQAYRSQLCQLKKGAGEVFIRLHEDDREQTVSIDASAYQLLPLTLKYS